MINWDNILNGNYFTLDNHDMNFSHRPVASAEFAYILQRCYLHACILTLSCFLSWFVSTSTRSWVLTVSRSCRRWPSSWRRSTVWRSKSRWALIPFMLTNAFHSEFMTCRHIWTFCRYESLFICSGGCRNGRTSVRISKSFSRIQGFYCHVYISYSVDMTMKIGGHRLLQQCITIQQIK